MILGISAADFTLAHVIISLIGIATGLVCVMQLSTNRYSPAWTGVFLTSTVTTSVTGFFFHSSFGPPHVIGVLSLIVLMLALYALVARRLSGGWRHVYVASAVAALYLNVFVGVVQAFQKIGPLHVYALTGSEAPFAIAQGIVLVLFLAAGYRAWRHFRAGLPGSSHG